MKQGSLVMLAKPIKRYTESIMWLFDMPIPIVGETICELAYDPIMMPKNNKFPVGIILIEYARFNFYWNIEDWIEVSKPSFIDIVTKGEEVELTLVLNQG